METDTEGAASEQDGDEGRAEHLELAVAVGVAFGRGLAREPPAEERDEVADEVLWGRRIGESGGAGVGVGATVS